MSELLVAGGQVLRPEMTVEVADVLVDQDSGDILEVDEPGALDGDDELVTRVLDISGEAVRERVATLRVDHLGRVLELAV